MVELTYVGGECLSLQPLIHTWLIYTTVQDMMQFLTLVEEDQETECEEEIDQLFRCIDESSSESSSSASPDKKKKKKKDKKAKKDKKNKGSKVV